MLLAAALVALALGVFALVNLFGRKAESWTYPDGLYSLSFAEVGWRVGAYPEGAALFLATPRSGGQSQCWANVTASPLTPCGSSQQCLNAAVADMTFEGSNEAGFTLSRRELSGVAIAETAYEKGGLYWRGASFALPQPPGLEMHDIHCVAALPVSEADKAAIETILGSLKFGPAGD